MPITNQDNGKTNDNGKNGNSTKRTRTKRKKTRRNPISLIAPHPPHAGEEVPGDIVEEERGGNQSYIPIAPAPALVVHPLSGESDIVQPPNDDNAGDEENNIINLMDNDVIVDDITVATIESKAPSKKKRKKIDTAYWCFTWNNPMDHKEAIPYTDPPKGYDKFIHDLFHNDKKDIEYIVYGREIGESGTFHLQGFVQFGEPIEDADIKTDGPAQRLFQAHWTKARRVEKARKYCFKDGNYTELGQFCMRQGKRTDLDEFKKSVEDGTITNLKDARKQFSEVTAKFPRFVAAFIEDSRKPPTVPDHPMYPWQTALYDKLCQQPHDREIMFIVDTVGNTGKSWFARRLSISKEFKSQYMTPGKLVDMAYALEEDVTVLLMDCPRSRIELFQYDFVEYVKNGMLFSSKYESRMKRLSPCHVVVFMNEHPDTTKLSMDRYNVVVVDKTLAQHNLRDMNDIIQETGQDDIIHVPFATMSQLDEERKIEKEKNAAAILASLLIEQQQQQQLQDNDDVVVVVHNDPPTLQQAQPVAVATMPMQQEIQQHSNENNNEERNGDMERNQENNDRIEIREQDEEEHQDDRDEAETRGGREIPNENQITEETEQKITPRKMTWEQMMHYQASVIRRNRHVPANMSAAPSFYPPRQS
jgi:hypothetical protein